MPALAKIQPKRIDLVQLIRRSLLTDEQKTQYLAGIPSMTMGQKAALTKMLLDAEDRLVANADKIVAEIQSGERNMWRRAEAQAKHDERKVADDILNSL